MVFDGVAGRTSHRAGDAVGVHVGMVSAFAVVQRVLDELEAGNADGVETEMVGAASVAQSDRGYADVLERLHPLLEIGPTAAFCCK